MSNRIELTLHVDTGDEGTAVRFAEALSRFMISMSHELATVFLDVDRYEHACDPEHDEVEP